MKQITIQHVLIVLAIVIFFIWYNRKGKIFCHCINGYTAVKPDKVRYGDRKARTYPMQEGTIIL